jgi:hypothetical protein
MRDIEGQTRSEAAAADEDPPGEDRLPLAA